MNWADVVTLDYFKGPKPGVSELTSEKTGKTAFSEVDLVPEELAFLLSSRQRRVNQKSWSLLKGQTLRRRKKSWL